MAKTPCYIFAEDFEIFNETKRFISHDTKYTEMPIELKKIEFKYNLAFGSKDSIELHQAL